VLLDLVKLSCTIVKKLDVGGRPWLKEQLDGGQLSGFKVDGRKTRECNHCLRESAGLQTTRVVEHNT
jgi:hypothetical protein